MVKCKITKITFEIHFLVYVVAFFCVLTGLFKKFIIFSSIIMVHELGHILVGILFNWKIEKVILLPFGGITVFNDEIDKPLIEELLIALAGPFFQIIYYMFFRDDIVFANYNIAILFFNLLPMYPLDGSKILNVLFNMIFSFKRSYILSLFISFVFCLIFIFFSLKQSNVIFLIIIFFVLLNNVKEISRHNYYFSKFLLERYMYEHTYKKEKIITKIDKMKKQTRHIFKIKNTYYTEKEIIRKLFDK